MAAKWDSSMDSTKVAWMEQRLAGHLGYMKDVGEEVYLAESWAKLMAKQWVVM